MTVNEKAALREENVHLAVRPESRRLARLLAADTGRTIADVVHWALSLAKDAREQGASLP